MKILQTIENIMIGTNEYSNILNKNKCTPPLGFYANTSKAKKYLNWKQNTSLTKGIIKILKHDNDMCLILIFLILSQQVGILVEEFGKQDIC